MNYLLVGTLTLMAIGGLYKVLIEPKLWMRQYGDGVYSPLRKAYKRAGK